MVDPLWLYKLKTGLLGPAENYGGILDQNQTNAAQNNGLMNFGAALLAAGGPSRTPTSLGQALGGAVLQGRAAQQGALNNSIQSKIMLAQLANLQEGKKGDLVPIIGPNGNPIYARASDAVGKIPVSMGNTAKDAASLQEYQQYVKDQTAAGKPALSFLDFTKALYANKAVYPYSVNEVGGVPNAFNKTNASATPLTTLPQEAQGKATVAGAEAGAKVTAESEAQNKASLGSTLDDIAKMRQNITDLLGSPGFNTIYGASSVMDPRNYIRGTDAADAQAKREQLSAETFGITIQKMRGLGQLSDAEGKKVTAAYTRATNPILSDSEARKAWNEVYGILDSAEKRAREKAGFQPQDTTTTTKPRTREEILKQYGL